jgi:hypothetical protein
MNDVESYMENHLIQNYIFLFYFSSGRKLPTTKLEKIRYNIRKALTTINVYLNQLIQTESGSLHKLTIRH